VLGEIRVSVMDKILMRAFLPTTARNCCNVQSALGFAVTLTWAKRRVPCSMTTNTYSIRNVAVTIMKKSQARIAFAWVFR